MTLALVIFIPSNDTQLGVFNEYVKYFLEKQRAGVVTLKRHILYLLPPGEATNKVYPVSENEILGVFVENSDSSTTTSLIIINVYFNR